LQNNNNTAAGFQNMTDGIKRMQTDKHLPGLMMLPAY